MSIAMTKKKKKEFLENIKKNHGLIQATIDQVGISRFYYDKWLKEDPIFNEACENLPRITKDYVESKLFQLIEEGDKTSIIFFLKCKGGYVETQHIKQETTYVEPLRINIIQPQLESNEPLKIEEKEQKKLGHKL